jgi:hypothetical protein
MENKQNTPVWPDLTIDQDAFREARIALGEAAGLSEVLRLAQEIKGLKQVKINP